MQGTAGVLLCLSCSTNLIRRPCTRSSYLLDHSRIISSTTQAKPQKSRSFMFAEAQLSSRRHARGMSTTSKSSSVSSCSASTSPQGEQNGCPSWILPENRRPRKQDTTSLSNSRRPRLAAPLHKTSVSSDRGAMPQSPPSSPLPLPHSFNHRPVDDISTKNDQRRCTGISEKQRQRGRLGSSPCIGTTNVGSGTKERRFLENSQKKPLTSDMGDRKQVNGSDGRPRFSVSTTSSPRPQACAARPHMSTKTRSKDVPLCNPLNRLTSKPIPRAGSTSPTRINRSRADFCQHTGSSRLTSSGGPCTEATLTKSTRTSSLRSQTAITTTTTTTTRKVASTTITLGPSLESERYKRANSAPKASSIRRKRLIPQDVDAASDKQDPMGDVVLNATAMNVSDTSSSLEDTTTASSTADSRESRTRFSNMSPLLPALDMDTHQEMEIIGQDHGPITTIHPNATAEAMATHVCSPTGPSSPTSLALEPDAPFGSLNKSSADGHPSCPPYGDRSCIDVFQFIAKTAPSEEACASLILPISSTSAENPRMSGDVAAAGRSPFTTKAQDGGQSQRPAECATSVLPEHGFIKASTHTASKISLSKTPLTKAKDFAATSLRLVTRKEQKDVYNCDDRTEGRIKGHVNENRTRADTTVCASKCVVVDGYNTHPGSNYYDKNRNRQSCKNHDNEQTNDNSNDNGNDNDGYTANSTHEKCPQKAGAIKVSGLQSPPAAASAPTGISFRDKMQFLKNQEMRSSSARKRNQSGTSTISSDASNAPLPLISALSPSKSSRQKPQGQTRSTPASLSDFPSSLFTATHRYTPTFSARTLASLAPAIATGLTSTPVMRGTKSRDLSFASISSASSLQDAVATPPAPRLSLTRSLSSPRPEQVSLRLKFLRPRIPLFEKSSSPQVPAMMKGTQPTLPADVTTATWTQASPRDQFRELASPSVTLVENRDSTPKVNRGHLSTRPSVMNIRRSILASDSQTEELCYFTLPIRRPALSPSSISPLHHLGRQPFITTNDQKDVQEEGPQAGDISILTNRFSNLRVMDTLCPLQNASSVQEHDGIWMDASWAAQISQLLNHLADKADLEEEQRGVGLATESSSSSRQWLRVGGSAGHHTPTGRESESDGLYRQILRDWLMRLNQLSGEVFETHSGLKRDVDKIRWQHNITFASTLSLHT